MQAVILAAGKGTRLPDITEKLPKPLIEINGRAVILQNIDNLKRHGITDLFINLHHLPDLIRDALGDGAAHGVHITYNFEPELLGTAGALLGFERRLEDEFIVLYSDTLRNVDYTGMMRFHAQCNAFGTIAFHEVEDISGVGIVQMDDRRRIHKIIEKPKNPVTGRSANAGVYLLKKEVVAFIKKMPLPVDFAYDVFPRLLEAGLSLYGFPLEGAVIDIGTPERLEQAQNSWK